VGRRGSALPGATVIIPPTYDVPLSTSQPVARSGQGAEAPFRASDASMRVCLDKCVHGCFPANVCTYEQEQQPQVKEAHGRIARTLLTNQAPPDRTLHCAHGWADGRAGALPALAGGAVAAQATVMTYVLSHAPPSVASQPGAWSGQRHPPAELLA
jgi:hypothetical protein